MPRKAWGRRQGCFKPPATSKGKVNSAQLPEMDTDGTLHIHRAEHTQTNTSTFIAFHSVSLSNLIYVYTHIYSSRGAESSKSARKNKENAFPKC